MAALRDTSFRRAVLQLRRWKKALPLRLLREAGLDTDPLRYDPVYTYPPYGEHRLGDTPPAPEPPPAGQPVDLYVHLPFCAYSCRYCFFSRSIRPDASWVRRFLEALVLEMRCKARWLGDAPVETVAFGGGTPTFLTNEQLAQITGELKSLFRLAPGYEWTVEASPDSLDARKLQALVSGGVNRISLGVQTTRQELLDAMTRRHTVAQSIAALETIQAAGVPRVHVDLIYGLPGQRLKDLWADVELIERFGIRAVSWQQLYQAADTPLHEEISRRPMTAAKMHAFKLFVGSAMGELGFITYNGEYFTRSGEGAVRHYMNKSLERTCVALGPGALGEVNGFKHRNADDLARYVAAVHRHGWAIEHGSHMTAEQSLRRKVFFGLRSSLGLNIGAFAQAQPSWRDDLSRRIERCLRLGLLREDDGVVRVSPQAQPYALCLSVALAMSARERAEVWRYRTRKNSPSPLSHRGS